MNQIESQKLIERSREKATRLPSILGTHCIPRPFLCLSTLFRTACTDLALEAGQGFEAGDAITKNRHSRERTVESYDVSGRPLQREVIGAVTD